MTVKIPNRIDELPISKPRYVGRGVPRIEDRGLITGRTEFIDNVNVTGMLHCAILRSPVAHARIVSIDTREAEKLPASSP
jgi:CO/xanthine dehydrogenase Mo-binding subunit